MSPVMLVFDTSATSLGAKASIAVTLCSFGIFTTGLLHWFTSPYVRQLVFDKKSNTMEIETLSVFARPQITRAHLAEISYPDTIRPQVTFAVNGKFFYLDDNTFPDKELLAALTPPEPSAAGSSISNGARLSSQILMRRPWQALQLSGTATAVDFS
ncbi:hypothetical protein COCSUDRAFT_59369 [Coccomyxa subellipsoidea C-169]|uniref:Uncharacterized protein n=1 Tax=Coccomyxa subellipsoidea (strain C-169) TaxID=574566 RepID=I0Z892_COCSC|nr:hypothetical protein COCSUDRAFT_59369 [Coccomyxa subellipsoidea C-169]EIE26861.1 hypothetical protein COCSUDRAFT_59369 [Coccomyxa subellipsoidea C-169]|eukprot:XP_005651405.1 hypothetical protein COCSUDRAFT_59369 [Coccomyxa subellipsoidea C-169]